jgi:hypothetical protein
MQAGRSTQQAQGYSGAPRHTRAWTLTVSDVARAYSCLLYAAYILQDSCRDCFLVLSKGDNPSLFLITHWRRNSSSWWRRCIHHGRMRTRWPLHSDPLLYLKNISSYVCAVTLKKFCNGEKELVHGLAYTRFFSTSSLIHYQLTTVSTSGLSIFYRFWTTTRIQYCEVITSPQSRNMFGMKGSEFRNIIPQWKAYIYHTYK